MSPSAVALVPARAGSQRVPGKNVRPLAGHPLIAYSIAAARESGRFDAIVVSTDSPQIAEVAEHYGAQVPGLRPAELATSTSPDIDWVRLALRQLEQAGREPDLFSILRPTSPFRTGATIARAFDALLALGARADSIRAVRKCREHPGKMWVIEDELMQPLLPQPPEPPPLHSRQYQALPEVYVQNSRAGGGLDAGGHRAGVDLRPARGALPHRGRRGLLDRLRGGLGAGRELGRQRRGDAAGGRAGPAAGGERAVSQRYVPLAELGASASSTPTPPARASAFADACRLNALYMIARAGSGHIGTSLLAAWTSWPGCTWRCWATATAASPPRATTRPASTPC